MNTKNYHHIPQNLLLFAFLIALFVLPVLAFTSFKPAVEISSNVLGSQTKSIKGINIEQSEGVYKLSGIVSAKSVVSLPFESKLDNKQVYLLDGTENILVTIEGNILEVYNTSNTDKSINIVLY